jgi:thiamine-phosphate pyrophosphorylase
MRFLHPLLCLTTDLKKVTHDEQVRILIEEGSKFIQVRSKNLPSNVLLDQILNVSQYALENDVVLIINDFLEITSKTNASGIHLGKEDRSIQDARKLLGAKAVIGSTVHNWNEAKAVKKLGLSTYVGLGPYRNSKTKFDLNPLLTPNDIRGIVNFLCPIPVFLIGGIDLNDCNLIEDYKLAGLAVCSSLSSDLDYGVYVKKFINQIAEVSCTTV